MLTTPGSRRAGGDRRAAPPRPGLLAATGLAATGLAATSLLLLADLPALGQSGDGTTTPQRPDGLVVLVEHQGHQGRELIGVFGAGPDGPDPDLRRVRVWRETDTTFRYDIDKINCSRLTPLRITGLDGQLIVRQLNPGGLITPANRLDHQIWWAACQPGLAGRDPATLGATARQLGYSGQLPEQQQVLRLPGNR